MRHRRSMTGWKLSAVVALAALTSACGADPEPAAPPFTGTDGAGLYAQACAKCHGPDLRGTKQGPPFLDAIYSPGHHADGAFFLAVKRGARPHHWNFGDMPPVQGLTDPQIEAIVAFVRERQRAAGIN